MIIKLADIRIAVNNLYPYIEKYCEGYICHDRRRVDFTVDVSEADIARERILSERSRAAERRAAALDCANAANCAEPAPSDGYLETLAVYRAIAERLPEYDTVLFHGSVIAVDGEGYIFTAKSGTGKSTHTRLWREYFGDRAVMINDDKPLLRIEDGRVIAYGTPWNGKHRLSTDTSVPLRGLCVLGRAERNSIFPAARRDVYPLLLQQTYRPHSPAALARTLSLVDRMADSVPLWSLRCNMEPQAAITAYLGMRQTIRAQNTAERKQK